jgi:alkanesulfonate monooxygenase SsuD/methylene tetrahydromethanopterin reductase-like flavin-dependent oxidoreductase (luciferase family)
MIDEICLVGSKAKVRDDLAAWRESRVTTMIVGGGISTLRTVAELVLG